MKYCPNCGKEIISSSNFCSNCGFDFNHKNDIKQESGAINAPKKSVEEFKNAYLANIILAVITGIYVVLKFLQIFGTYTINLKIFPFIILACAIYANVINKKLKLTYTASIIIYIFSIFSIFFSGFLSLGIMFYFALILIVVPYGASAVLSATLAYGIKQNILKR